MRRRRGRVGGRGRWDEEEEREEAGGRSGQKKSEG
jgi:hypothetical protein